MGAGNVSSRTALCWGIAAFQRALELLPSSPALRQHSQVLALCSATTHSIVVECADPPPFSFFLGLGLGLHAMTVAKHVPEASLQPRPSFSAHGARLTN